MNWMLHFDTVLTYLAFWTARKQKLQLPLEEKAKPGTRTPRLQAAVTLGAQSGPSGELTLPLAGRGSFLKGHGCPGRPNTD